MAEYKVTGIMMDYEELNKYRGEITIWKDINDAGTPVLLKVDDVMMEYLGKREKANPREKYIPATYFYDKMMYLTRIEISSTSKEIPSKILVEYNGTSDTWMNKVMIFGEQDYIDCDNYRPAPMSEDEFKQYKDWSGRVFCCCSD